MTFTLTVLQLTLAPTIFSAAIDELWSVSQIAAELQLTLGLAVYRQSVCLGDKPLETQDQQFFFS
jgi:hypothetical protein